MSFGAGPVMAASAMVSAAEVVGGVSVWMAAAKGREAALFLRKVRRLSMRTIMDDRGVLHEPKQGSSYGMFAVVLCSKRRHCKLGSPGSTCEFWRSAEQRQCQEGSDPRTCGGKSNIDPVFRVADNRECREEIPHTAPGCSRYTPLRGNGSVEHYINCVCCGG